MTPERYRQIGELYHAALEVAADERVAFIERACAGDEELRREVESLISSHEQAEDFIAEPALAVAAGLLADDEADALTGRTIARYRVLSLVGAGGMGRVYLAEDTALGRRVALKLLPEYFTHDKNQVRRFRQEARAASALNHPNILTVYEVGQVDGTEFIATEYVEGETLRARLTRAPCGVREALDVAAQIADALTAAHAAGIVHRDVKPENVMLRADGYVKVLDFGLAKLTENLAGFGPAESAPPVGSAIRTNPGVVMGTAEYMSPEQARGLAVDERTDVWSLGVVLYEMVAGRRPFTGATHGDTIVAILDREPVPLARLAPATPSGLERIVTKALAKDVGARYQTVKGMALDLKRLGRRLEAEAEIEHSMLVPSNDDGAMVSSSGARRAAFQTDAQTAARVSAGRAADSPSSVEYLISEITRHKRGATLFGSVLILLLGGVSYGVYKLLPANLAGAPSPPPRGLRAASPLKLERLTQTGQSRQVAISPDGKYIAYTRSFEKKSSIWLRQLATNTNVEIVAPTDLIGTLAFANSGEYLYFVKRDEPTAAPSFYPTALYRVSVLGGVPTKIVDSLRPAFSLSADDSQIVFIRPSLRRDGQREDSLIIANADGTGERTLFVGTHPDDLHVPVWSPDGGSIICSSGNSDGGGQKMSLIEVGVADGTKKELSAERLFNIEKMAWLPDKSGLLMSARKKPGDVNQLWQVSYPGMEIRQLTGDSSDYLDLSVASGGEKVVATQANLVAGLWVGASREPQNLRKVAQAIHVCWTPDGRLVYMSTASGNRDLWIMQPDGTGQKQLTANTGVNDSPAVTPDNRYIVFMSNRTGAGQVWRMNLDGGNQVQLTSGASKAFPAVSPDGKWVLYNTADDWHLWKVSIDGGEPVRLTDYFASHPAVSPDGKVIACLRRAESRRELFLLPFAGGQPLKKFDLVGWGHLRWTPDGQALIYADEPSGTTLIRQPVGGGGAERIADFGEDEIYDFGYSFDGQKLAVARGGWQHDVVLVRDLNRY